ncbi:MAG: expansin EXLX1 family cellulose-binding protein [Flavobacteriales bacterium]
MKKQLLFSLAVLCLVLSRAQSPCNSIVFSGDGTYYIDAESPAAASATFNCTFVNANIKPYYGAMNASQYGTADYCGACVELTGNAGTKGTQIIEIVDKCPECLHGDIDLSDQAFMAIFGDMGIGRANMQWHEVACPWSNDPVDVTTQGSNQWYAKVIIARHKNRINKVEIYNATAWVNMTRTADNGWVNDAPISVPGNTQIRITDIFGQQVIVNGVEIASGTNKTFQGTSNFSPCLSTAIADYEKVRNVGIYPNPSTDVVVFDDIQGIKTICIYNMMGELVYSETLAGGASRWQLSLSDLSQGSYFVQLSNDTQVVHSAKLIRL